MSLKDLKEALVKGNVFFGLKQTLKKCNGKTKFKVFVANDARNETLDKLQSLGINFEFLKTKKEISKELGLDFESEIFLIN